MLAKSEGNAAVGSRGAAVHSLPWDEHGSPAMLGRPTKALRARCR